jgi:hypothetical protein
MAKISTYFTLEEFQKASQFTLTPALVTKATWMAVNVGDRARAHFGRAMYINSFARAVKPKGSSQAGQQDKGAHSTGDGADWSIPGVSHTALATWMADNLLDHGIVWAVIDEGDHVHTSRVPVAGALAGYLRSSPGSGKYTLIRTARQPGTATASPSTPPPTGGVIKPKPSSGKPQPTTTGGSTGPTGEAPRGGGLGGKELLLGGIVLGGAYLWWKSSS